MQQRKEQSLLFNAKATTWTSVAIPCWDRMHTFLSVYTTGNANFTMLVKVSRQVNAPDFSAAASPTNQRALAQIKISTTNAAIDWATGITSAGTDLANEYEINTNGQAWVWLTISAISAGAITAWISGKNNQ